jgi:two-component system response regulator AtoC
MDENARDKTTSEAGLSPLPEGEARVVLNFYHDLGVLAAELEEGPGLVVGRGESADVQLPVRSLSRQHARFVRRGAEVWVEDLGSRNGVECRGQRLVHERLLPGSAVRLGNVTVVMQSLSSPAATPAFRPEASGGLVVRSRSMQTVQQLVQRVAVTDMPVLVVGETGVGKELVALAIHGASPRKERPFRTVNCGAIPEGLLTSVLFGHEKGAFTGAVQTNKGLFEEADGGTLFLDEIGELSPATQAALLRVLETHRITRVGSQRERPLDTRVIAATHRDLEAMAEAGTFRTDLLFRLNAFVLNVPALRERQEEIEPLVDHFMQLASTKFGAPRKQIAQAALDALRAYHWPGNVRELRNVVERAMVMSDGPAILLSDLPERLRGDAGAGAELERLSELPDANLLTLPPGDQETYRDRVREYEVQLLTAGLRVTNGNQTRAAELLKLPLRTLVHKMKLYGIRRPDESA